MLSEHAVAVLRIAADLAPDEDQFTDSRTIAQTKFERDKAAKRMATFFDSGPWFGYRPDLDALESAGLIEVDAGIGSAVPFGEPAPTTEVLYVSLTPAGFAYLGDN